MDDSRLRHLVETRVHRASTVAELSAQRRRPTSMLGDHGKRMVIAADHVALGALRALERPTAMGDRQDVREDLLLLGVLDDNVAIGSMKRGGLHGSVFRLADRFTSYDAEGIAAASA